MLPPRVARAARRRTDAARGGQLEKVDDAPRTTEGRDVTVLDLSHARGGL